MVVFGDETDLRRNHHIVFRVRRVGGDVENRRERRVLAGASPGAWTPGQLLGAALVTDATGAQVTVGGQVTAGGQVAVGGQPA